MTARMCRRQFLGQTAKTVCAAVPLIIPVSALGRAGRIAPNERIVVGSIGVGGMGFGDMSALMSIPDAQVVAACDVKRAMRDRAKAAVDAHYKTADCAVYNDFRELLARDDIDVVSIASLDCWHVLHALAAVRAGKDVYVEKPLGMSIHEIKVLRDAVHRYGRVFQFGTQQRSSQEFRHACEIARNGRLGKVHTIKVGVHSGAAERSGLKTYVPERVPDGFDYNLWLGPAPGLPTRPRGSSIPTGSTSATIRWAMFPVGEYITSTSPSGATARKTPARWKSKAPPNFPTPTRCATIP